jgi:hypothetical protein
VADTRGRLCWDHTGSAKASNKVTSLCDEGARQTAESAGAAFVVRVNNDRTGSTRILSCKMLEACAATAPMRARNRSGEAWPGYS